MEVAGSEGSKHGLCFLGIWYGSGTGLNTGDQPLTRDLFLVRKTRPGKIKLPQEIPLKRFASAAW